MIHSQSGARWRPGRNPYAMDIARLLGEDAREDLILPVGKVETLRIGTREEAEVLTGFPASGVWYEYVPPPAVGTELNWINTYSGVVLQPFYVKFRIVTSAAVGSRVPSLVIVDGGGSIIWGYGNASAGGTSGGSTSKIHQYMTNGVMNGQGQGWGVSPVFATDNWLAELMILPGWSIRTNFSTTLDVGDQITDIAIGLRIVA